MKVPTVRQFDSTQRRHSLGFASMVEFLDSSALCYSGVARGAEVVVPHTIMRVAEAKGNHVRRNYLWIRRPARRMQMRHDHVSEVFGDIKVLPALILFATFISIAFGLSLFVH
jgi:hypothetical protein